MGPIRFRLEVSAVAGPSGERYRVRVYTRMLLPARHPGSSAGHWSKWSLAGGMMLSREEWDGMRAMVGACRGVQVVELGAEPVEVEPRWTAAAKRG